ncbi:MAG TPA: O-acetyl-ADP-ribose deacetylase [Anaerovoracaceae bacterium]|nr:O-acetyl-ADP-ribose deacetylase [Anaerovoracaceae bacterium]
MPLEIIRNDITKVEVDVIVNAANKSLLGGGGVDGAIHRAAGPELLVECKTLKGCNTGEAKITKGYNLPAKYVIHTVGPVWHGGKKCEENQLRNCYKNSLELAKSKGLKSIAFPLISSGVFGYPKDQALKVATSEISDFILKNDMLVYIVVFDTNSFIISEKLLINVRKYIDDKYVSDNFMSYRGERRMVPEVNMEACYSIDVDYIEKHMDESFAERLFRFIDERNLKDSYVYKRANIDRKHFSKIRNDLNYKPGKKTVFAFAIALELNLDDTKDLLNSAGYSLSHSKKFDVIIEYFIVYEIYNIFEINETLYAFKQQTLGS